MDMRKNEKGSSLIFALAVISIITMVIAACMAISYSYYNRSIVANSERQAYLTAKSVATYVVNDILSGSEDFVPTEDNKTIPLNVAGVPIEMGYIDSSSVVILSKDKIDVKQEGDTLETKTVEKITVSVTAAYGNKIKTVNADLMQYQGDEFNWQLREYYEGKPVTGNINNDRAEKLSKYSNDVLAIYEKNKKFDDVKKALKYNEDGSLSDLYKNCEKWEKGFFDKAYYNDTPMRKMIFYGYYDGKYEEFDKSLINSNISEKAKKILDDMDKIYIQNKFPYISGTPCIIFGYTESSLPSKWDFTSKLVYCSEDKAWYIVYNGFNVQSDFDDYKKDVTAQTLWNNFVKDTLHNESFAEKIT